MRTKNIIEIILFQFLQNCLIIMKKKGVFVYCTYYNKYLALNGANLLKFTRQYLN